MKCLLMCLLYVVSALAEPPVNNRYLPPQTSNSSPSQAYGAPSFGGQRQTSAGFGSRPSSTHGAPSRRTQSLSNQYIPPRSSERYQSPNQNQAPTSLYQAPSSLTQTPTSLYQAPSSLNQSPASSYQAPVNQYQPPSSQYGLPNQAQGTGASSVYSAPSQEYGLPGIGRAGSQGSLAANDLSQSRQYLPPGRSYDDGSNGEPANYNFEYMVLDQYSGNDFGHRESRQGERAEGLYYVLLPDGRKQTVEYEADEEGYKPRISYEETGAGAGYDRNTQAYSNQYENGPY